MQTSAILKDCFKLCHVQLESAGDKVKANKEAFDESTVKVWKDRIIELAKEVAVTKNTSEMTIDILGTVLGEKRQLDQLENASEAVLKKQIIQRIEEKASGFDVKKDVFVKKISDNFKVSSRNNDDDFQLVEEAFKLNDTICPYTRMKLVDAMKSTSCKHHISKEALDMVLRASSANNKKPNCPVAGCLGRWTRENSSLDEEFQLKVDRFMRLNANNSASQHQEATQIEDDEEAYTQI